MARWENLPDTAQWLEDAGILVLREGGLAWQQQCNGMACDQRWATGDYAPFPYEVARDIEKHHHVGCTGCPITGAEADTLDAWLRAHQVPYVVDRDLLLNSVEAWVYVRDIHGTAAVLTWNNCD